MANNETKLKAGAHRMNPAERNKAKKERQNLKDWFPKAVIKILDEINRRFTLTRKERIAVDAAMGLRPAKRIYHTGHRTSPKRRRR